MLDDGAVKRAERLLGGADNVSEEVMDEVTKAYRSEARSPRVIRTTDLSLVAEGPLYDGRRHYLLLTDRQERVTSRHYGSRADIAAWMRYAEHNGRDSLTILGAFAEKLSEEKTPIRLLHQEARSLIGPSHLVYDEVAEELRVFAPNYYEVAVDIRDVPAGQFRETARRLYGASPEKWVEGDPLPSNFFVTKFHEPPRDMRSPRLPVGGPEDLPGAKQKGSLRRHKIRAYSGTAHPNDLAEKLRASGAQDVKVWSSGQITFFSPPGAVSISIVRDLRNLPGVHDVQVVAEEKTQSGDEELIGQTIKFQLAGGTVIDGKVVGQDGDTLYIKSDAGLLEISTDQLVGDGIESAPKLPTGQDAGDGDKDRKDDESDQKEDNKENKDQDQGEEDAEVDLNLNLDDDEADEEDEDDDEEDDDDEKDESVLAQADNYLVELASMGIPVSAQPLGPVVRPAEEIFPSFVLGDRLIKRGTSRRGTIIQLSREGKARVEFDDGAEQWVPVGVLSSQYEVVSDLP